jgi:hypothetical protein
MKFLSKYLFLLILPLLGCTKDLELPSKDYPYVITEVPRVSPEGVTFSADLTDPGSNKVLQYGFVWSEHVLPTKNDYHVIFEPGINSGRYTYTLNANLKDTVTYYVRAYVTSDIYEVYGKEISFSSQGCLPPVILGFSPNFGPIGTEVIIDADNIDPSWRDYVVKFGNNVANIERIEGNKIYTKVPVISTPEMVRISVQNAGKEVFSADSFDLWFPWIKKGSYQYKYDIFHSATFTFNNKGYILPNSSNNLVEFNPESNSFTVIAHLPENSGNYPLAVASPEYVYMRLNTGLYKYNPLTSEWFLLYKFPDFSGSYTDYMFYLNSAVYLGFGQNLSEFNETTLKWTPRKPFDHLDHCVFKNTYTYNNAGYIILGEFNKNASVYKYSPDNDSWEIVSTCPTYLQYQSTEFFCHFIIQDKIYTDIGKRWDGEPDNGFLWQYDLSANTWSQFHEVPNRTAVANSITLDGIAYVLYGNEYWQFIPEKN